MCAYTYAHKSYNRNAEKLRVHLGLHLLLLRKVLKPWFDDKNVLKSLISLNRDAFLNQVSYGCYLAYLRF